MSPHADEPAGDRRARAAALVREAEALNRAGRVAEAAGHYAAAAGLTRALLAASPGDLDAVAVHAGTVQAAGMNLRRVGDAEQAAAALGEAAGLVDRLIAAGRRPAETAGPVRYELGRTLAMADRHEEAIPHLAAAVATYAAEVPTPYGRLADAHAAHGRALARRARGTAAVLAIQRAVRCLRAAHPAPLLLRDAPPPQSVRLMAHLLSDAADVLCAFGHLDLALSCGEACMRCFDVLRILKPPDDHLYRVAAMVRAEIHRAEGQVDLADRLDALSRSTLAQGAPGPLPATGQLLLDGFRLEDFRWPLVSWAVRQGLAPVTEEAVLTGLRPADGDRVLVPSDRPHPGQDPLTVAHAMAAAATGALEVPGPASLALATEAHCLYAAATTPAECPPRHAEVWKRLLRRTGTLLPPGAWAADLMGWAEEIPGP